MPEELGPLQVLASALHVRFRGELGGKRFDDAVRTAKTMFALSRHLGEHPTEVASRLGLWSASLTLGTIEEMVQQPGCPNLYWALTDLPHPLVDVRKGVQGQCMIVSAQLRPLHDDGPMTETELEAFVSRLSGVLNFGRELAGRDLRKVRKDLEERARNPERVRAARGRLVEAGGARERVNKFPPLQVILLDEKRDYELERDERLKLLGLALWESGSWRRRESRRAQNRQLIRGPIAGREQAQAGARNARATDRHASPCRGAATLCRRPRRRSSWRTLVRSPCRRRSIRFRAGHSIMRSKGRPPTFEAGSTRSVESGPRHILHYEVTVQNKIEGSPLNQGPVNPTFHP